MASVYTLLRQGGGRALGWGTLRQDLKALGLDDLLIGPVGAPEPQHGELPGGGGHALHAVA